MVMTRTVPIREALAAAASAHHWRQGSEGEVLKQTALAYAEVWPQTDGQYKWFVYDQDGHSTASRSDVASAAVAVAEADAALTAAHEKAETEPRRQYTVVIEGGHPDNGWANEPATVGSCCGTAEDIARDLAAYQPGADWRIHVWDGADADTSTDPAFTLHAPVEATHGQ